MRVVLRYILVLAFGWAVWGVAGGATLMAANVIAVDVTGKAALSQKGAQKARRNALEDALYLAALKTGADLSGITITSKGRIVRDVITLGTEAQLVDFNITGERNTGTHYEVSLKAFFAKQNSKTCAKPAYPSLTVLAPRLSTAQSVNIHYHPYTDAVAERLVLFLTYQYPGAVETKSGQTLAQLHKNKTTNPLFDYNSLKMGLKSSAVIENKYAMSLSVHLSQDKQSLKSDIRITVHDGATLAPIMSETAELATPLPANYVLRSLNVLLQKTLSYNEPQLAQIAQKIRAKLTHEACNIRRTKTLMSAGKIRVAIGQQAGLRQGSLAYIVDGPHSWTLLEVQSVAQNSAVLKPVNALKNLNALANQNIQFIDGAL